MLKNLLQGELYSKLITLKKHYNELDTYEYATKGSRDLIDFILDILDIIDIRFERYSDRKLYLLKSLLPFFGKICGYISESRLKNIPWSIVPAYARLFKTIHLNTGFILCPIWETSYSIINTDILEILFQEVLSIKKFIFDFDTKKELESKVKKFRKNMPDGIYIIFFPKIERLSALHFSLLGHEIGHIFAAEWLSSNFDNFIRTTAIDTEFERMAMEDIKKRQDKPDMFVDKYILQITTTYLNYIKKILCELIADIYGAFIFGQTTLISSFLFSFGSGLDDTSFWSEGYLSWKYRLKNIKRAIDFLDLKKSINPNGDNITVKNINKIINEPHKDNSINQYISMFLVGFNMKAESIFEDVIKNLNSQIYLNYINQDIVEKVKMRFDQLVTPNSYFDENLNEFPIDFRNILSGTWQYCFDCISSDFKKYEIISKQINLLSIKGIEMSVEQDNYNDFIKERDS